MTHEIAGGTAPPRSTWPPVGAKVTVSSTRRDKDGEGPVLAIDAAGIRIRRDEDSRDRFYPWGQVAFVEWFEEEAAAAAEAAAPQDASTVALALWHREPVGELADAAPMVEVPDWWANEMRNAGFPMETFVKRAARYRDIIEGETAWDASGGALGAMLDDIDEVEPGEAFQAVLTAGLGEDENVPDDIVESFLHAVDGPERPEPARKGRMLMEPEVRAWHAPKMLVACGNPPLALWAALSHSPAELGTLYALHEGNFAKFIRELVDESRGVASA
jgi:hypothetical protein